MYDQDNTDVTEAEYFDIAYEVAGEYDAFTNRMFDHIKSIGGLQAAENAKERAVSAGRIYFELFKR
jgi:hypothetical protein